MKSNRDRTDRVRSVRDLPRRLRLDRGVLPVVLLAALVTLPACNDETLTGPRLNDRATHTESTTRALDLGGVERVVASTLNGSIVVRAQASASTETPHLVVRKTVRAWSLASAREFVRRIRVDVEVVGNELRIHSFHPRPEPGMNVTVDYELRCPEELALSLDLTNGVISVEDVAGPINAGLINGRAHIAPSRGASGAIMVRMTSGIMDIVLPHARYCVTATAASGCIVGHLDRGNRTDFVNHCQGWTQTVHLGDPGGVPCDLRVTTGTIQIHVQPPSPRS